MSQLSLLNYGYLAHFSRPAADRRIYRILRRNPVQSIVELGIGDGRRAQRMIRVVQRYWPERELRYAGIDLFEARPADQPRISLKAAFTQLRQLTPQVQLAPGDPCLALARIANSLSNIDLLLVSVDLEPESLAKAWSFVPRMLHPDSLVLCEEWLGTSGKRRFKLLGHHEVRQLATAATRQLRQAA
jgi:hypothetical protein